MSATSSMVTSFDRIVPKYMGLFMRDFKVSSLEAAAVFGNLAHECAGFTKLQEINPLVKGSRGGYGWAQWTGPRRREYETYCKRHGYDPAADESNYKYLFVELTGTEQQAIKTLKESAPSLEAKVIAFERTFLRAGIKHDKSRYKWAVRCLDLYEKRASEKHLLPPAEEMKKVNKPVITDYTAGALGFVVLFIIIALLLGVKL